MLLRCWNFKRKSCAVMAKITVHIPKSSGYKLKTGDMVSMHGKVMSEDEKGCTAEMEMPEQSKASAKPPKKKMSPVEYVKQKRRMKTGMRSDTDD